MWVTLFAVQSLDGRITRHDEPGDAFSSAADKVQFRAAMQAQDAWIMGGESFRWMLGQRVSGEPWRAGLRRIVWTRTPKAYVADAVPGVLEFTEDTPAVILAKLQKEGCQRCALLGGGQVYGAFLAAKLVDEVVVTVEPRVFGAGRPLAGDVLQDTKLRLTECASLGESGTVRLRYEVIK